MEKNSLWKYFSYFSSLENPLLKNENKYDSSFKLGQNSSISENI